MPKIGRNAKCPCGSSKKYKKCCLLSDEKAKQEFSERFVVGHTTESEKLQECIDYLKEKYDDHKIIDVTNYLNNETYTPIQLRNFKNKTIMVAERNDGNNGVFSTRGPEDVSIMVMYHGAYQCFAYENMKAAEDKVFQMIDDRIAGTANTSTQEVD